MKFNTACSLKMNSIIGLSNGIIIEKVIA